MIQQKRSQTALLLITLLQSVSYGLFVPIFIRMMFHGELEAGPTAEVANQVKNVISSTTFFMVVAPAYFFIAPVFGCLSDTFGRKRLLILTLLFCVIGYGMALVSYFTHSITLLSFACLFISLSFCHVPITQAGFADFSKGKARFSNFSLMIALMMSLLLASLFANHIANDNYLFVILVVQALSLVSVFISYQLLSETNPGHNKSITLVLKQFFGKSAKVMGAPSFYKFLGFYFLIQLIWGVFFQGLSNLLIQHYHFQPSQIDIFILYFALAMMLPILLMLPLLKHYFKIKDLLLLSLSCLFIGLLCINFDWPLYGFCLSCLPIAFGICLFYSSSWTILSYLCPRKLTGLMFGILGSVWGVCWIGSGMILHFIGTQHSLAPMTASTIVIFVLMMRYYIQGYKNLKKIEKNETSKKDKS